MIFRVYSFLTYVFSVVIIPLMAVRLAVRGKGRAGVGQRFGFFKEGFFTRGEGRAVWFHAVSVGETLAAVPVVKGLLERDPSVRIYFSTVTETGSAVARESLGDAARVFYFPFDFGVVVRRVLGLMRPDLFVVVETEIWPNLLNALHERGIPAVMINGRISPRSYRGYSRARFFIRRVLGLVSGFNMQSAVDAERIKSLGAPPERVRVVGNIKFDQACRGLSDGPVFEKAGLGIPAGSPVMVAGSTHEGEEAEVLAAYRDVLKSRPDTFLILAPRHPERLKRVESLLREQGLGYSLRSAVAGDGRESEKVILLDTMGELAGIYRIGDINFVGGSLVPVGGHNVLEPAAFGKPVFFGPHMHNFSAISDVLKDCGVGIQVEDGPRLAREAVRLMQEPDRLERIARSAKEALLRNRGALERNIETIEGFLGQR